MRLRLLAFGVASSLAAASQAVVLYNNFGAGDSYNTGIGWTIASFQSVASPFSVTGNYTLSSVTLGLFNGSYTVSVAPGGSPTPGADLVSWSFSVSGSGGTDIQTLTPGSTVNLTTGDYFVVVNPLDANTGGAWDFNDQGDVGDLSFFASGSWSNSVAQTRPVFRVEAAPVPEPASLIALGGLSLVALRRRRKA